MGDEDKMLQATRADEVQAPEIERLVELPTLKTKGGRPVVVRCLRLGILRFGEVIGGLPGENAKQSAWEDLPAVEQRKVIEKNMPILIEAGTALEGPDGGTITPAFWFGEEKPGALPGAWLGDEDRMIIVSTILTLGGYIGGAAAQASFPGDGAGRAGGDGAVEPVAGTGDPAAPPEGDGPA